LYLCTEYQVRSTGPLVAAQRLAVSCSLAPDSWLKAARGVYHTLARWVRSNPL